jgi:hypothetical protein
MTHWTKDDKQVEKFIASTQRLGYDEQEVLNVLEIKTLEEFKQGMGAALTLLSEAKKAAANNTPESLAEIIVREDLYPDEETRAMAAAIARVAPWAHNKNHPLDATDIALAVQRSLGMGLDPLNPHEVQIWKDARGLHLQLAYTLLRQWATQILGGHTEPRYIQLDENDLKHEGLNTTDVAYWCEFVMREDISLIGTMVQAGWEPVQARNELTVRGLGTASRKDWNGDYFAPNGRSKAWKVKNRAYTDAIRSRFGTPSQPVIEEMRRLRGEENIIPADWQLTASNGGEERVRLAAMEAQNRIQEPDSRSPGEILEENREILHGEEVLI